MLDKFLREVIIIVVGKQAEEIAGLLNNKKYTNEFTIAKKLDLTINQTRNILYKISDYGLVSSIRKKDKRKGWYTYFWKIETIKALGFLKSILVKRIDQIRNQIKSRETKRFYVCNRCNVEFNEENVLLSEFTCNECGDLFVMKDNTKTIKELKRNLEKLERKLSAVDEEIEKEEEKYEKMRQKELKKIEKEKQEARAIKRKATAKLREKLAKKAGKKIIKKKPAKKKTAKKARPRVVKLKKKRARPSVAKLKKAVAKKPKKKKVVKKKVVKKKKPVKKKPIKKKRK